MTYPVYIKDKIDFENVPKGEISVFKWLEGYKPYSYGQLIFVENKGFALRMCSEEAQPKTTYTQYNDPVYKDSCVEFFVNFNPAEPYYMNFEMNSAGAFLAARRTGRKDKIPLHQLEVALPQAKAFREGGFWGVEVFFPLEFVEKLFGVKDFKEGYIFKGNFYKCGDETEIPHFGMWAEIDKDAPDFHCPEFFGEFILCRHID